MISKSGYILQKNNIYLLTFILFIEDIINVTCLLHYIQNKFSNVTSKNFSLIFDAKIVIEKSIMRKCTKQTLQLKNDVKYIDIIDLNIIHVEYILILHLIIYKTTLNMGFSTRIFFNMSIGPIVNRALFIMLSQCEKYIICRDRVIKAN